MWCRLLDLPSQWFPVEDETPEIRADEDANYDIAIVVHGEPASRQPKPKIRLWEVKRDGRTA